ncbi:MAG: DUF1385 domain-containing protein [Clostridiales bacterium]|nr:DUF1385 domain-containing protein [Clostridiales bacterium]
MKYSGVGGQAVMEGVMMRNDDKYAVAVRKPDHTIEVKVDEYKAAKKTKGIRKVPIIRGVFSFIDSLYLGMSTLMYSASFFEEDEEGAPDPQTLTEEEKEKLETKKKREDNLFMAGTVVFSVVFALAIFFIAPYFLSGLLHRTAMPEVLIILIEGLLRLAIFIAYVVIISFNPDIKRVYMYHGAEHKCINCIEHGLELNVENVRNSSKEHKRCGTSFMLIVMLISIVVFLFIQMDSRILRLVVRLLLIPVIAGISFEFIRLAGRYDNALVNVLSRPGLWMQGLTTREPDDEMIEVGIASVEAVFDWKKWQVENGLVEPEGAL